MSSVNTKDIISQSFKKLMEKKSFDKITISDISNEAKINRQTFYYHFHDKYELLNTIYYNDVIVDLIDGFSVDNWTDKFLTMLNTLKSNSKFYKNALCTSYGGEFRTYLLELTQSLLYILIGILTEGHSVDDLNRKYVAKFFSYGITGTIIDWIMSGMKESPEIITEHLNDVIEDCKILLIAKYAK